MLPTWLDGRVARNAAGTTTVAQLTTSGVGHMVAARLSACFHGLHFVVDAPPHCQPILQIKPSTPEVQDYFAPAVSALALSVLHYSCSVTAATGCYTTDGDLTIIGDVATGGNRVYQVGVALEVDLQVCRLAAALTP